MGQFKDVEGDNRFEQAFDDDKGAGLVWASRGAVLPSVSPRPARIRFSTPESGCASRTSM